jgi:hypothetical protein
VSSGDGMGSNTQVPTVRSAWAPMALSYYVRHLMSLPFMDPTPIAFPGAESPECGCRGPGMFQAGLQGGSTVG